MEGENILRGYTGETVKEIRQDIENMRNELKPIEDRMKELLKNEFVKEYCELENKRAALDFKIRIRISNLPK